MSGKVDKMYVSFLLKTQNRKKGKSNLEFKKNLKQVSFLAYKYFKYKGSNFVVCVDLVNRFRP